MTDMIYIFWTCAESQEAETVVKGLLEQKLIACASILPPVISLFRWQGNIEKAEESKVILKTRAELFNDVASYIKAHCSYDVPEIASVGAEKVFEPYLHWMVQETTN